MGYLPATLRKRHGDWFSFVLAEGDLSVDEGNALHAARAFLSDLEITALTRSYKLLTLRALVDAEALESGLTVSRIAQDAWAILQRSPELLAEVPEDQRLPDPPDEAGLRRWVQYWRSNPIAAWTGSSPRGRAWFRLDEEDRLRLQLQADPAWAQALSSLVYELVDYRLVQYRRRKGGQTQDGFTCKVTWNRRDPILKLPSRELQQVPEGETDVRLADGSIWLFRFAREFCNVARPAGEATNRLPDLLRKWFGPRAGEPGTAFQVRFAASPDGLWVEPVQGVVVPLFAQRHVVAYPDLRAAAGLAFNAVQDAEAPDDARVLLPVEAASPDLFAVRVTGTSMDGGPAPLRDGDWAVFRHARGAPAASVAHRVVLVQVPASDGSAFQIKRIEPEGDRWRLMSDNPSGPSFLADAATIVVARLEGAVRPEELAPTVGTLLSKDELAAAFGVEGLEPMSGVWTGHRFVMLDRKGMLVTPNRLHAPAPRRPGETIYVLSPIEDSFRYLGVGRWIQDERHWGVPEVDFVTMRAWGEGRLASRALPPDSLVRAQSVVGALLRLPDEERQLERSEVRVARILGAAQRGGLRLDIGAESGERTVSLTDLAWVIVAQHDVDENGGLLDEARVNRLRYLDGTPKGSTRWIDTGWAIAAWSLGRSLVAANALEVIHPQLPDGTQLDATFVLEELDGRTTIVVEARGRAVGSAGATNTQYAEGLQWLLARLKAAGLALADVTLDTRATTDVKHEDRRLSVADSWPLLIEDPVELQRRLGRAQARWGKVDGKLGGNPTRRIRIWMDGTLGVRGVAEVLR